MRRSPSSFAASLSCGFVAMVCTLLLTSSVTCELDSCSASLFEFASAAAASAPSIDFGRCVDFAVMAGTAVNANGVVTTVQTGNVGVAPGSSITGNLILQAGAVDNNNQAAINCAADNLIAYQQVQSATCPPNQTLASADIAGLLFYPGVYCGDQISFSASTVTLDGAGRNDSIFIFQSHSSLVTSTATSFILQNGANADHVYWQVSSSATLAYSSSFVGTILAYQSISVGSTVNMVGRCLAQAAVTFAGGATLALPQASAAYTAHANATIFSNNQTATPSYSSSTGAASASASAASSSASASASGSSSASASLSSSGSAASFSSSGGYNNTTKQSSASTNTGAMRLSSLGLLLTSVALAIAMVAGS